jgi:hypothetical protein
VKLSLDKIIMSVSTRVVTSTDANMVLDTDARP